MSPAADEEGVLFCYVLDDSEASTSEDYSPSRWAFQQHAVACLAKAALASPNGDPLLPTSDTLAVISMAGHPRVTIPPTQSRASLRTQLSSAPRQEAARLGAGLKLALVRCVAGPAPCCCAYILAALTAMRQYKDRHFASRC